MNCTGLVSAVVAGITRSKSCLRMVYFALADVLKEKYQIPALHITASTPDKI